MSLKAIGPNFLFFFQIEIEAIFQVNPELLPSKSVLATQVSMCKLFLFNKGWVCLCVRWKEFTLQVQYGEQKHFVAG